MNSADVVAAQNSAGDEVVLSCSGEPGSVSSQRPLHVPDSPAARQHCPLQTNGSPPGVYWGEKDSLGGEKGEGLQSVADVIAEAMRESSVQRSAMDHEMELRRAFPSRTVVRPQAQSTDRPEINITSSVMSPLPVVPARTVLDEPSIVETDFHVVGNIACSSGQQRNGMVAQAMAEAILDDGSYATLAASNPAQNGTLVPPTRGSKQRDSSHTNGMHFSSRNHAFGGLTSGASVSPPCAPDKQDVGGTHVVPVDTDTESEDPAVGACPARGESGGGAAVVTEPNAARTVGPEVAPFGHAVIIEEHVRATAVGTDVAENAPPRRGPGLEGDEQDHGGDGTASPLKLKDGARNNVGALPGAMGYSSVGSEQACFQLGAHLEQERRATHGNELDAPVISRSLWGADEPGADGFLVLSGEDSAGLVDKFPSFTDSTGDVGVVELGPRDKCVADSSDAFGSSVSASSPSDEYIMLHGHEREYDSVRTGVGREEPTFPREVGVNGRGHRHHPEDFASQSEQVKHQPGPSRASKGSWQPGSALRDNGSSISGKCPTSLAGVAPLRAEETGRHATISGAGDGALSSFIPMSNEYEVTKDDNIWPQADSGEGLPEAMGGWGRIDKQGKQDREQLGVGLEVNGAMDEQLSTQLAVVDGGRGGDGDGDGDAVAGAEAGAASDSYGRAGNGVEVSVSTVCNRDDADDDSEDDGNDDQLYFALHDENGEPLEGLPGERSLYAAGAGGGHDEEGDLEDVLDDAEMLAHGTSSSLDVSRIQERLMYRGGDGDDAGEAPEESVVKGEQGGGGDEGDGAFLHSWDDLVEGVEDEGVLHGHGRAGLPDPLVDDEVLEDDYSIQVANGGVASYMEQFEDTEGLERDLRADDGAADEACDREQGPDAGGDGVACEEELDDGYQSGFEGRSGNILSRKAPVGGPLASRGYSLANLVAALSEAIGAHPSTSPELLTHFVRAAGGDVEKAAALYLSVAEEFEELRGMARRRRSISSQSPPLAPPPPPRPPPPLPPPLRRDSAEAMVYYKTPPVTPHTPSKGEDDPDAADPDGASMVRGPSEVEAAEASSVWGTGALEAADGARQSLDRDFPWFEADPRDILEGRDEYSVTVSSQKLGMTVENMLERTVVTAAAPGGGAESAGVETGSLVVAIDGESTKDSSHFEVIELLRKADRPLTLRLRRVGGERLLRRRAEMRALTQPQGVLATGRAELESRNSPNRAGVGAGPRDGEGNATGGSSFRAGKSSANVQIPRLPASPLPVRVLRRQDSLPVGFGLQEDSPGSCQGGKDGANTSIGEASDGAEEADGARGRPETPFTFPEAENGDGLSPEQGSASGVTPAASSAVPTETAPPLAPEHVVWKWKPGGDAEVGLDGGGVARGHLSGGMASAAAGMTANWEAVEWAESCLLAILRLICVGGEISESRDELGRSEAPEGGDGCGDGDGDGDAWSPAASAPGAGLVEDLSEGDGDGKGRVTRIPACVEQEDRGGGGGGDGGDGDRHSGEGSSPDVGDSDVMAGADGDEAMDCTSGSEYDGELDGESGADENMGPSLAEESRSAREKDAMIRLLLKFSDLLERDWSVSHGTLDVEGDLQQGGGDDPREDAMGGSAQAAGVIGSGVTGRRLEIMGSMFEQLLTVINWESEILAAVEPQLRELLCVLLDADLSFDLSSSKYPHLVGGAVAAALKELLLHLPAEQAAIEAPALAHRLAMSNSVCARGACCALVAHAYAAPPPPRQLQLRGILTRLLHDHSSGVREEAVKALAYIAAVTDTSAGRWMVMLGERASMDVNANVRRASVYSLLQIGHRLLAASEDMNFRRRGSLQPSRAQALGGERCGAGARDATRDKSCHKFHEEIRVLRGKLVPVLLHLAGDGDWQVRLEIACRLDALCVALRDQWPLVTGNVLPALVKDVDQDVQCEAIRCLPRLARILLGFAMSGYATVIQSPQVIPSSTDADGMGTTSSGWTPPDKEAVPEAGQGDVTESSSTEECGRGVPNGIGGLEGSAVESDGRVPPRPCTSEEGTGSWSPVTSCSDLPNDQSVVVPADSASKAVPVGEPSSSIFEDFRDEELDSPVVSAPAATITVAGSQEAEARAQECGDVGEGLESPGGEAQERQGCDAAQALKDSANAGLDMNGTSNGCVEAVDGDRPAVRLDGHRGDGDGDGDGDGARRESLSSGRMSLSLGCRGILQAGRRAQRDVLSALMPPAAVMVENPSSEVRGAVAMSVGEVLRLMVGFDDYVTALWSARFNGLKGEGPEAFDGDEAEAFWELNSSMATCCCVVGGEFEAELLGSSFADGDGFGAQRDHDGIRVPQYRSRYVCYGEMLLTNMAAAAASAGTEAEAVMTAELMDLEEMESDVPHPGEGGAANDEVGNRAEGSDEDVVVIPESGECGLVHSSSSSVGQSDVGDEEVSLAGAVQESMVADKHGEGIGGGDNEKVVRVGQPVVVVKGDTTVNGTLAAMNADEPGTADGVDYSEAVRESGSPNGKRRNKEEQQSADGVGASPPVDGEEDEAQVSTLASGFAKLTITPGSEVGGAASCEGDAGNDYSSEVIQSKGNGKVEAVVDDDDCSIAASDDSLDALQGDESGAAGDLTDMTIPTTEDEDHSLESPDYGSSMVIGESALESTGSATEGNSGGDPLIVLVTRLLNDADAHVACTMLQALKPAWAPELGPGPSPRPFAGVSTGAVDASAAAATRDDIGGTSAPDAVSSASASGSGSDALPSMPPASAGVPAGEECGLRQTGQRAAGSTEWSAPRRGCMLTPAQVVRVLPALAELFGSPLWRVRAAVAESLPALVSCTLCDRLKEEVISLGRRMLFDRVDAVRRAAAEQLVMAARIDLDRCPSRPRHHVPGVVCYGGDDRLPPLALSPRSPHPPSPLPMVGLRPELQLARSQDCVSPTQTPTQDAVFFHPLGEIEEALDQDLGGKQGAVGLAQEGGNWARRAQEAEGRAEARSSFVQNASGGVVARESSDGIDLQPCSASSDVSAREADASLALETPTPLTLSPVGQGGVLKSAGVSGEVSDEACGALDRLGVGSETDFASRDRTRACGLWLRLVMVPLMRECLAGSYRGRLLALHMTQALFRFGVTTPAVMTSVVVPALMRGLSDKLPNVRLTAARVADDILTVAAMSKWPPPAGRGHDAAEDNGGNVFFGSTEGSGVGTRPRHGGQDEGGKDTVSCAAGDEREANSLGVDGVGDEGVVDAGKRAESLGGGGVDGNATKPQGSSIGDGCGGSELSGSLRPGWGCGWGVVETKLEELSRFDPDRDVAFFASQALKPKWAGDRFR